MNISVIKDENGVLMMNRKLPRVSSQRRGVKPCLRGI